MGCIYTISCPITKKVIYVGKALCIKQRSAVHISCNGFTPIAKYINILRDAGLKPVFEVLEDAYDSKTEYYWIEQMRQWGFKLLNVHKLIK